MAQSSTNSWENCTPVGWSFGFRPIFRHFCCSILGSSNADTLGLKSCRLLHPAYHQKIRVGSPKSQCPQMGTKVIGKLITKSIINEKFFTLFFEKSMVTKLCKTEVLIVWFSSMKCSLLLIGNLWRRAGTNHCNMLKDSHLKRNISSSHFFTLHQDVSVFFTLMPFLFQDK